MAGGHNARREAGLPLIAEHRVRLPGAGLPIGEDRHIVAIERALQQRRQERQERRERKERKEAKRKEKEPKLEQIDLELPTDKLDDFYKHFSDVCCTKIWSVPTVPRAV